MTITVLGLDPSIANVGWAIVDFDSLDDVGKVTGMGLLTTSANKKRGKLVAEDDHERCAYLAREINALIVDYGIDLIAAESRSEASKGSRARLTSGLVWGSVSAVVELQQLALVQCSPQRLKKTVTGKQNASKEEVQSKLDARFDDVLGMRFLDHLGSKRWEHSYDALGAIVAALNSDAYRLAHRAMHRRAS